MNTSIGFTKFSDEKLYYVCKKVGTLVLHTRNLFLIMLPEVNRRKLFIKKGFVSIFHFAKALAGASEKHVNRVLNIEKRFAELPIMQSLLLSGKVSINKLAKVASVVTVENQEYWASQVQLLPTRAVETLVRDCSLMARENEHYLRDVNPQFEDKNASGIPQKNDDQNGLFEPQNEQESVHVNTFEPININRLPQSFELTKNHFIDDLELSDVNLKRLRELKKKNIDINAIIEAALNERENEIEKEKAEIAQKSEEKFQRLNNNSDISRLKVSRHIAAATNHLLKKEFGTKCAIPECTHLSTEIHHTARFSISKSHNPYFLAPLCKEHHQIAHATDIKVVRQRMKSTG